MKKPAGFNCNDHSSGRRGALTPAEQREYEHEAYWNISVYTRDEDSWSPVDGIEVPIAGREVDLALDYSIEAASRMLRHPDPAQRWANDVALFTHGRLLATIHNGPAIPVVERFETVSLPPYVPGSPRCRRPCIRWVDGSLESTSYGVGTPIGGRDPGKVINELIASTCETMRSQKPDHDLVGDVILTHRGRILAAIRLTASGPVVTRFGLPDSPSGSPTDPPNRPETFPVPIDADGQ